MGIVVNESDSIDSTIIILTDENINTFLPKFGNEIILAGGVIDN